MRSRQTVGILILAFLVACACTVSKAGVVRHFELDTIAAGTTPDTTGNSTGTVSGSPTVNLEGVVGSSFEFTDSDSQNVTFGDPFFGDNTVTLSYWVRRDTTSNTDGPAANWNGGRTILSRISGTALQTYARVGASQSGTSTGLSISDTTTFHHVAITYNGASLRTFLDGNEGTAFGRTGLLGESASGTFAIGGRGGSEAAMDGLVDEVAMFDEALSVPKVKAIGSVALDPTLNYHASRAQSLFDVFDGASSSETIGSHTWVKAADGSLPGSAGDVVFLGGGAFGVVLNDDGGGVTTDRTPPSVYRIDIDSIDITSPPIETAAGWTSLDATGNANAGSVLIDGIDFHIGSAVGSRIRRSGSAPDPNDLLADFVYDNASGGAVVLYFGGAGDLAAGTWEVQLYIWDADRPNLGEMYVAYRENGSEHIVAGDVLPNANGPAYTFRFDSDGVSAYDIFVREHNTANFSLINAVVLTRIPEPSTFMLSALGLLGLAFAGRRRRKRVT